MKKYQIEDDPRANFLTGEYDDVTWREIQIGMFIIGVIIGALGVWFMVF